MQYETFSFEYSVGGNTFIVETEILETPPFLGNAIECCSRDDYYGGVDIDWVRVYDKNTHEDVDIVIPREEIVRQWEIQKEFVV